MGLGGEAIPACPSDHDNQAILYVYGGSKAHQFKVIPTHEQGDDEIISYLFGGTAPAEDKQVDDMVAFLYGGDYTAMTEGTQTPDVNTNVAKFMLGATTQAAVHTPPAGTSFVKDDVALVERSRVLEELTEWSPSQTYSKAQWMLEESNIHFTDDQLALYMLSGSTTESDNDVHEISDVLFGSIKLALTSVQIPRTSILWISIVQGWNAETMSHTLLNLWSSRKLPTPTLPHTCLVVMTI